MTLENTEVISYFYNFTYEKKHVQQFILPVSGFFVNLLADRKAVKAPNSPPKCSMFAGDTN